MKRDTFLSPAFRRKRGKPARPIDEAAVLERLRAGESAKSIAAALHVDVRRIHAVARANGIAMRRPGRVKYATEAERRAARRAQTRASDLRRQADARQSVLRFTCAKCGRDLVCKELPHGEARGFVRLGGKTWCESCASRRFPRRVRDYDASFGEVRIQLVQDGKHKNFSP